MFIKSPITWQAGMGTHCLFCPRQAGSTLLQNRSRSDWPARLRQATWHDLQEMCHGDGLWNSPYVRQVLHWTDRALYKWTSQGTQPKSNERWRDAFPAYCKACMCQPCFQDIKILGRSKHQTAHELMEAYYIKKKNSSCISNTSVMLNQSVARLFDRWISKVWLACACMYLFLGMHLK